MRKEIASFLPAMVLAAACGRSPLEGQKNLELVDCEDGPRSASYIPLVNEFAKI
jgi:hypothetical protein